MENTSKNFSTSKIFYLFFILIIISGITGWFIYKDLSQRSPTSSNTTTPGVVAGNQSSLPDNIDELIPDLDKEIVFKVDLPEDYKQQIILDIEDVRSRLRKDYNDLQDWLQLGLLFKVTEDYERVQECWEFGALIRPYDSIVFHNLGDLYHLYLPDFPRSEENYFKAIENDPGIVMYYQKLHELYTYSYEKKEYLADDVLIEGLKNNPNNPLLQYLLDSYNNK